MINQPSVGDRVWWRDPDPFASVGAAAQRGVVVGMGCEPVFSDTVIMLEMDNGGIVECVRHELYASRVDAAGDEYEP